MKAPAAVEWAPGCTSILLFENACMNVKLESMQPGTSEITHLHTLSTQIFIILQGTSTFEHSNQTNELPPNSWVIVLPHEAHCIHNKSDEALQFIVISSPPAADNRINL